MFVYHLISVYSTMTKFNIRVSTLAVMGVTSDWHFVSLIGL